MKPVQYIVANKGLGMSGGKLAAQVAHAALNAWLKVDKTGSGWALAQEWLKSGHTKIVLEARDTEHLLMIERYINERGIQTALIIDEGRTEIAPHTPTALASVIVDKSDPMVEMAFGDLRIYRDEKQRERPDKAPEWLKRFVG